MPRGSHRTRTRLNPTTSGTITLSSNEGMQTRSKVLGAQSRLYYPENQSEQFLGKIRFAVHKATPLSINADKINRTPIEDRAEMTYTMDPGERAQFQKESVDVKKQAVQDAARIVQGVNYKLSRTAPIIDMYIPLSLTYNDGVNYENANLNVIGTGTLEGMTNADNIFLSAYEALASGIGSAFGYIMNPSLKGEAARLAALRASQAVPNAGFQAAVQIGVQRAMNPNTRALFRNVNLRQFTFQFKMIANSQREAIMIERIIKHFRTELYPDVIDELGGIPVAYKYPNAFSIQFTHRGAEAKIPKIEYCFLRNVQTNFNPTGAAFHQDGRPNEIDLTLTFTEMRTLNRRDVMAGY